MAGLNLYTVRGAKRGKRGKEGKGEGKKGEGTRGTGRGGKEGRRWSRRREGERREEAGGKGKQGGQWGVGARGQTDRQHTGVVDIQDGVGVWGWVPAHSGRLEGRMCLSQRRIRGPMQGIGGTRNMDQMHTAKHAEQRTCVCIVLLDVSEAILHAINLLDDTVSGAQQGLQKLRPGSAPL